MGNAAVKVLLVEDDPGHAQLLLAALGAQGGWFDVSHVWGLTEALDRLGLNCFEAMLLDLSLPDVGGPEAVLKARSSWPGVPIIALAGPGQETAAAEALRNGAWDCLPKEGLDGDLLARVTRMAAEQGRLEKGALQVGAESCRHEGMLQAVLDAMVDPMVIYDRQGKSVRANRAAAAVGFDPSADDPEAVARVVALARQHRFRRPDGSEVEPHDLPFRRALRGQAVAGERYLATDDKGRDMTVVVSSYPVRSGEELVGAVSVWRDVTEEEKLLAAVSHSEARYRAVIEGQTELICRFLPDGTLTFVNEAFCQCFAKAREDLLGRTFVPLLIEEDRALMLSGLRELGPGLPCVAVEARVQSPDGSVRWQQWTARAIPDHQGGLAEIQAVGRDVTERKQAEASLRRIEWLLTKGARREACRRRRQLPRPSYGDLTELNPNGELRSLVGADVLVDIAGDYLELLDTSTAIHEGSGDYALGIQASGYCRFLAEASRRLCGRVGNRQALASGRWLCHESCWTRACKVAVETGRPCDVECAGGLRLYAAPIRAGQDVVGAINFGYGDPPRDRCKLLEIARLYRVDVDELARLAEAYESRPAFLIDVAKNRLGVSARLIGSIVEHKRAERDLRKVHDMLEQRVRERTVELGKAVADLEQEVRERLDAEARLRESEQRYRFLFDSLPTGIAVADRRGRLLEANRFWLELTGCRAEELTATSLPDLCPDAGEGRRLLKAALRPEGAENLEVEIARKDGSVLFAAVSAGLSKLGGRPVLLVALRDVSQRKEAEFRARATSALLELFARKSRPKAYLEAVAELMRELTGCCCVGIRLANDRGELPYEAQVGFGEDFVQAESKLAMGQDRCACVRVALGEPGPHEAELTTPGGSFICPDVPGFMAGLDREAQSAFRGRCAREGFGAVAVVPIRYRSRIVGVIHLADPRKGAIHRNMLEFLESVTPLIGEAVYRFKVEDELRRMNRTLRLVSYCNEALVRSGSEDELLQSVCRKVVAFLGHQAAWVGLAQPDKDKTVRAAACAGMEGDWGTSGITWGDRPGGDRPAAACIRTGRAVIVPSIRGDTRFEAWRREALRRGYRACLSLPLAAGGKTLGAMTVYSGQEDVFDEEEVHLLREVADDLAFGVLAMRTRKERELAEAALRQSGELLERVFSSISVHIAYMDREFNFIRVNPAYAEAGGRSPESFVGKNHFDLYPHEENKAIFRRVVELGQPCFFHEKPFVYPERPERGTTYWDWSLQPVRDAPGEVAGVVLCLVDVTERVRARQRADLVRRRLFAVLDMLPGYVCLHGPDHSIRFANRRFVELFGQPGDRPCHMILWGRPDPCQDCRVERILSGQDSHEWEWTAPDGRAYHVWGYPFADPDGAQAVLELGIDVTARKRMEKEILDISEHERQRIGQDLHDALGQELTGVALLSKALSSKLQALGLAEAGQAAKIAELVSKAVAHTRAVARGLSPVSLEADGLMTALKELAGHVEQVYGLACSLRCSEPVFIHNNSVATHLYHIVQEAVTNAVRHSRGKEIRIGLDLDRKEGQVVLTVRDDGIGIGETPPPGEGMGLHTMRYRANAVGASLQIRRGLRGGTVVTCSMPQSKCEG